MRKLYKKLTISLYNTTKKGLAEPSKKCYNKRNQIGKEVCDMTNLYMRGDVDDLIFSDGSWTRSER